MAGKPRWRENRDGVKTNTAVAEIQDLWKEQQRRIKNNCQENQKEAKRDRGWVLAISRSGWVMWTYY